MWFIQAVFFESMEYVMKDIELVDILFQDNPSDKYLIILFSFSLLPLSFSLTSTSFCEALFCMYGIICKRRSKCGSIWSNKDAELSLTVTYMNGKVVISKIINLERFAV